jgi:single-strand DNA-binding protein
MPDTFVSLVGNLTDDPEVRFTPQGAAVANFRLAVTPRVREGDTWKDGEASFFRINVWRDLATHTADSLSKGDRALVLGRLRSRSWEDKETGERRSVVEVEAEEVGPSLRWATAKPQRTSRKAGNGNGPSKGGAFDEPSPF